jgi:hypothetical protein
VAASEDGAGVGVETEGSPNFSTDCDAKGAAAGVDAPPGGEAFDGEDSGRVVASILLRTQLYRGGNS